jgi:hypothetical protein
VVTPKIKNVGKSPRSTSTLDFLKRRNDSSHVPPSVRLRGPQCPLSERAAER